MKRRDFIKSTCLTCAGAVGLSSIPVLFSSCHPLPSLQLITKNSIIEVPFNSFQPANPLLIIKNPGLEFDILLIKNKDSSFNALYMQCTHENQPLTANKTGLFCPSHGSAFDFNGVVTLQPATKNLKKFKTEVGSENILIHLNKLLS